MIRSKCQCYQRDSDHSLNCLGKTAESDGVLKIPCPEQPFLQPIGERFRSMDSCSLYNLFEPCGQGKLGVKLKFKAKTRLLVSHFKMITVTISSCYCFSLSLSLSVSTCLFLCLPLSLCLFVSLSLCLSVSVSFSQCHSVSLFVYMH